MVASGKSQVNKYCFWFILERISTRKEENTNFIGGIIQLQNLPIG